MFDHFVKLALKGLRIAKSHDIKLGHKLFCWAHASAEMSSEFGSVRLSVRLQGKVSEMNFLGFFLPDVRWPESKKNDEA